MPQEYLTLSLEKARWRSIIITLTTENQLLTQRVSDSKRQTMPVVSKPLLKKQSRNKHTNECNDCIKCCKQPDTSYRWRVKKSLYEQFIHIFFYDKRLSVDPVTQTMAISSQTSCQIVALFTQKTESASQTEWQYYCWVTGKESTLVKKASQSDPIVGERGINAKLKIRQPKADRPTPAAQHNRKFQWVNKTPKTLQQQQSPATRRFTCTATRCRTKTRSNCDNNFTK